jgi:hypothetical protein
MELVIEAQKDSRPVSVIFADKNYSVNYTKKETDRARSVIPEGSADLAVYFLIPDMKNKILGYFLSSAVLVQSYFRLRQREIHETLDNTDVVYGTRTLFYFARFLKSS